MNCHRAASSDSHEEGNNRHTREKKVSRGALWQLAAGYPKTESCKLEIRDFQQAELRDIGKALEGLAGPYAMSDMQPVGIYHRKRVVSL
jgi:hypothetical protein